MTSKLLTLSLLMVLGFSLNAIAQNGYGEFQNEIKSGSKNKLLKKARRNSEDADFTAAIARYRMLLKSDPDNVTYNKELGMTFFDSPYQKVMSIPYLEKAISKGKQEEVAELYYPLGVAYRMKGEYAKAKDALGLFLNQVKASGTYLSAEEEKIFIDEISREIEICNNAETFSSIPPLSFVRDSITYVPVVTRIPAPVNSIYDDYSSVYANHDSTLIFTSRRKGSKGGKVNWDGKFFEDILVSERSANGWSEPASIGDHINSTAHEAVSSISRDEKKLYIYKTVKNGSLLELTRTGRSTWSEPEKLSGDLNSKAWETSLGVTLYDSVVYFVSDRKGGTGGRDIYVSRKDKDGKWSEGEALGPVINTPYEEDSPFLSADGNYLYFASTGHNTMGGFDLFRSARVNGNWTKPENLGSPVNTENHDIYLMFSGDGDRAWLSSQRISNDTLNDMNIYDISFECATIASARLKGRILKKEDRSPVSGKVFLTEQSSLKTDSVKIGQDGNYFINVAPAKEYLMVIAPDGYQSDSVKISVPKQCKDYDLFQLMTIENTKDGKRFTTQKIELHNAFFDIRKKSGSKGGTGLTDEYVKFISSATDLKSNEGYSFVTLEKDLKEGDVIPATEVSFVNILFDYDRSELKPDAKETLDKVAKFLTENSTAVLELRGFADSVGTEAYNKRLSENRSLAAQNYLVKKGIRKSRLISLGLGEAEPLNDNGNDESRQRNRRVEFKVYPKGKE